MTTAAPSTYDTVTKGLRLAQAALVPFVHKALKAAYKDQWWSRGVYWGANDSQRTALPKDGDEHDLKNVDLLTLLTVVERNWNDAFYGLLKKDDRSHLILLRSHRNAWAHSGTADPTVENAYSALDTVRRVVENVGTPEQVKQAQVLAKQMFDTVKAAAAPPSLTTPLPPTGPAATTSGSEMPHDLSPGVQRQATSTSSFAKVGTGNLKPAAQKSIPLGLKPWRDVVSPHRDVAGGTYSQAEFAADLSTILAGNGEPEYQDPQEFFARTYLTEGMRLLLSSALRRLAGKGGEPVVQLKTAFGGGKTHSMIALYHLANSRGQAHTYPGLADLYGGAGVAAKELPGAKVAVLVGTALDGTRVGPDAGGNGVEVRTLWGEMAAQLGGQAAYAVVAEADRTAIAPGSDTLVRLFEQVGPCLVLIDELVAYARKLHGVANPPAGTFESQMSFVQSLTEAVKRAPRCLLVVSTPESDTEIGGEAGREAQSRLEHILGRVESIWKPVGALEGFEIVRRRLFLQDGVDEEAKEAACRAIAKLYAADGSNFPSEARTSEYLDRIRSAYPIHPEVFDRLYNDWSTLERFQRTRGVLRLMAHVINALWTSNDRSVVIMPGGIPLDDPKVQGELTRYLGEGWSTVLDRDVDGPQSEPMKIEVQYASTIGKHLAARRVARAIFLGTAPHAQSQRVRGIEAARIRLGVVQPSDGVSTFNDALGHLTDRCAHLYTGDGRYWYDTRPNLLRTAADRAAQVEPYKVTEEVERRLREMAKDRVDFAAIHVFPQSGDVPDEAAVRLVVLPLDAAHRGNKDDSEAMRAARKILDTRGGSPRLMKNMLVFAAADESSVQGLDQAARQYLAWTSIQANVDALNLDTFGRKQANEGATRAGDTLRRRVGETYVWLLTPSQRGIGPWEWKADKIAGSNESETFVHRAARKLRGNEDLIPQWSPAILKMFLDKYLWAEADHVETKRVWDTLTNYGYAPRLKDISVLREAIAAGLHSADYFAYAGSVSASGRYEGLAFDDTRSAGSVLIGAPSVLVKPEIAIRQLEQRIDPKPEPEPKPKPDPRPDQQPKPDPRPALLERFYGSVQIDAQRPIAKFSDVVNEVAQHLTSLPDSEVTITVTIEARVPGGASEQTVRTVTENSKTLKFQQSAFEEA